MGRTNSSSVECTFDKTYHIHSINLIKFSITDDPLFHAEEMQASRSSIMHVTNGAMDVCMLLLRACALASFALPPMSPLRPHLLQACCLRYVTLPLSLSI